MTTPETPTDPQALRDEIAQTRSDFGETIEALAAKADVAARAKGAAGHVADQAKEKAKETVQAVREQAGDVAATVGRRPVPVAAIAAGAALIGLAVYLIRRWRS